MIAEDRRRRIVRDVNERGLVRVSDLAAEFSLSEVSVRSDLAILERQGLLLRIRGGAVRRSDQIRGDRFRDRLRRNARAKTWIAERAASLVEDGDSIFLDASSTAFGVVRSLRGMANLTIFTNGLETALAAAELEAGEVILFGGSVRAGRSSLGGQLALRSIADFHFRKAFLSCAGLSFESGLMEDSLDEAELKRLAVAGADQVIGLVDSTKIPSSGIASFAPLTALDELLVDRSLAREHVERLRRARVSLTLCGEHYVTLTPGAERDKPWRIGFANLNDEAFASEVRRGLERAAQAAGVDLVVADNAEDVVSTLRNVDHFIRENVDLVIEFQPWAAHGESIMSRLRDAGIPVIAIDIPLPGATFFGADNYRAGRLGGRAAAEAALGRWEGEIDHVISLELPDAGQPAATRMIGMLDGLREIVPVPEERVDHVAGTNIRSEAQRIVAELLAAIPQGARTIALACNDELGIGAIDAYREADRVDELIVVTQGADTLARRELATPGSPLVASVSLHPDEYGDRLIPLALAILEDGNGPAAVFLDHQIVRRSSEPQRALS